MKLRNGALYILSAAVLLSGITACNDAEIGNSVDVNQSTIYFDYNLTGYEDIEEVTLRLQYKFAGPNGTTLLLTDPSQVTLDGVVIKPDSTKMSGVYYEVIKPKDKFTGDHVIEFTDHNKKTYTEKFSYTPFGIQYNLPDTITTERLVINLTGLKPIDYVNVLLTDTVFTNSGVNRIDTVKNGELIITKADLDKLTKGPVYLDLQKEENLPVKNGTNEGGKFNKHFSARKAFLLVE